MSRYTTIFWDVDGTLLDFSFSQRYALKKCFHTVGREITEEQIQRYDQINNSFWRRFELGEVTKEQLLPGRFLQLFEEFDIRGIDLPSFLQEYQEGLGSVFSHLDDSLTICKSLQGHVHQYVVTNGVSYTQRNKLELSGLAEVMDGIFISEEVGVPKPEKMFFDYCLDHVGEKDRTKILIVGESLSSDIKGGAQAGIVTCWYRPDGTENISEYHPDHEISDLHMIYDILGVLAHGKVGGTKAEAAVYC